ncbi:MAG: hypothetical protein CVV42_02485 [Candidatus Riflebacteria bacterium HGW-Riflebacteria-2]|jgi:hypothetical protein|nr:MAG: hypothetical protein CVV42_02485 [Candidatus Riflebacteria bacterium HGW-Riflebacteria-2]
MRTKIAIILLFLAFCATAGTAADEYQWETLIRINTPVKVWQAIAGIEELQPVFDACADKTWDLLLGEHFVIPEKFSAAAVMYVAIGRRKDRNESIHAIWSEKPDGTKVFLGAYNMFLSFFEQYHAEHPVISDGMEFPEAFAKLDQGASFHLQFLSESAVSDISEALTAELMREDKRLDYRCQENLRKLQRRLHKGEIAGMPADDQPVCPLHGKYSFDAATKKFVCSHQLKKPDLAAVTFDGYQEIAYSFVKTLQGLKSFDIKLDNSTGKLVFEVDFISDSPQVLSEELAMYGVPGWFQGLADLEKFPQSASLHLVLAPDFSKILNYFRSSEPGSFAEAFAGKKLEEIFPQGPLQISLFGDLNPGGYSLPAVVVSAGLSPEKYASLRDFAISQGMPLQPQKSEIYGREVDLLEMPVERQAFNRQESDQRIFILSESAQRTALCVGEMAAREKLALDCGERQPVSLFADIKLPVKLAFAYRAEGLGHGLLQRVNFSALHVEAKECAGRFFAWKETNKEAYDKLNPGDRLPDDLARLCPRNGYFWAGEKGQEKIMCAVHSYQASRESQMQFIKADIPTGRWLRAYVMKDGSKRRLVLDFYRPGEVK